MKGWGKIVAFGAIFFVYAGFMLYRLVRDIVQEGLTGPNIFGSVVFVFLPLLFWALTVGTTRFNRSHMARTRAAFPACLSCQLAGRGSWCPRCVHGRTSASPRRGTSASFSWLMNSI